MFETLLALVILTGLLFLVIGVVGQILFGDGGS